MYVVNVHRRDPHNVGDWHAAPAAYFPSWGIPLLSLDDRVPAGAGLIVGGGALFHPWFRDRLSAAMSAASRTVGWGLGHNEHGARRSDAYPASAGEFGLLGMRDWGCGAEYVPCPSCLSPVFDRAYDVRHEVVVYDHKDFGTGVVGPPQMTNAGTDLEAAVAFLGSAETVVTSAYHGAYWAMLLGRRVVVCEPFSSKFFGFRYPPPLCRSDGWADAVRKRGHKYEGFLDECREINRRFAARAWEVLGM